MKFYTVIFIFIALEQTFGLHLSGQAIDDSNEAINRDAREFELDELNPTPFLQITDGLRLSRSKEPEPPKPPKKCCDKPEDKCCKTPKKPVPPPKKPCCDKPVKPMVPPKTINITSTKTLTAHKTTLINQKTTLKKTATMEICTPLGSVKSSVSHCGKKYLYCNGGVWTSLKCCQNQTSAGIERKFVKDKGYLIPSEDQLVQACYSCLSSRSIMDNFKTVGSKPAHHIKPPKIFTKIVSIIKIKNVTKGTHDPKKKHECHDGHVKPDKKDCVCYFKCVGGHWKHFSCEDGKKFDPISKTCKHKKVTTTTPPPKPCKTTPKPTPKPTKPPCKTTTTTTTTTTPKPHHPCKDKN